MSPRRYINHADPVYPDWNQKRLLIVVGFSTLYSTCSTMPRGKKKRPRLLLFIQFASKRGGHDSQMLTFRKKAIKIKSRNRALASKDVRKGLSSLWNIKFRTNRNVEGKPNDQFFRVPKSNADIFISTNRSFYAISLFERHGSVQSSSEKLPVS